MICMEQFSKNCIMQVTEIHNDRKINLKTMKAIFIIFFLTMFLPNKHAFADSAQCFKYYVDINLVNGEKITGYYFHYGMYMETVDSTSFDKILNEIKLVNERQKTEEKLTIFKKVGILENPKCWDVNLFYCYKEDVVELSIAEIKSVKVIEMTECHPENIKLNRSKYCGGCRPEVITELSKEEVSILKNKPNFEIKTSYEYERYFDSFCEVYLLSYSTCDSTMMMNVVNKFIKDNNLESLIECMTSEQYDNLKSILREKKVIMLRTYYYN